MPKSAVMLIPLLPLLTALIIVANRNQPEPVPIVR